MTDTKQNKKNDTQRRTAMERSVFSQNSKLRNKIVHKQKCDQKCYTHTLNSEEKEQKTNRNITSVKVSKMAKFEGLSAVLSRALFLL